MRKKKGKSQLVFDKERKFVSQYKFFIERSLKLFGITALNDLPDDLDHEPHPLLPVFIKNYLQITNEERKKLKKYYALNDGIVYFYVENHSDHKSVGQHPLVIISNQLKNEFLLDYPISYPYDFDLDTKLKFGEHDGTTKVYESTTKKDSIALSTGSMSPHQDGMGLGGSIGIVAFYCDSQPLVGGITFFQNVIKTGLQLLKTDKEAFCSLFYHDSITYIRKNERKGIKIVSPIFYLNNFGEPAFNLKFSDSLHDVFYRNDKALARAIDFFTEYCKPFAFGSKFVQFTSGGLGCFINNLQNIHGRTSFVNGPLESQKRIISRKWFSTSEEYSQYQFFPGILIQDEYSNLYPELFGEVFLKGFWRYNPKTLQNERVN